MRMKRVYDPPDDSDGYRILVDRLWPRGLSQEQAAVDLWLRLIAPSDELRTWFHHEGGEWPQFAERYREELASHSELLDLLLDIDRHRKKVTLLFGAKDERHNQAAVILEELKRRKKR